MGAAMGDDVGDDSDALRVLSGSVQNPDVEVDGVAEFGGEQLLGKGVALSEANGAVDGGT